MSEAGEVVGIAAGDPAHYVEIARERATEAGHPDAEITCLPTTQRHRLTGLPVRATVVGWYSPGESVATKEKK